jgi:hypothetical protein
MPLPKPARPAPTPTADAAQVYLRRRWRLLCDLARVDAVLAARRDDGRSGEERGSYQQLTLPALEELRAMLADDLDRLQGTSRI